MAITEKSLRFMGENHEHNSREWFAGHRAEYAKYVEEPMLELSRALAPVVLGIDPLLIVEPKRTLSKIWRDVRFSRDKSLFKRGSWLAFKRSRGMVYPVWFFEFTPDFYHYGCGYYLTPPKVMSCLRELVLANDTRYRAAQKALDGLPEYSLSGERYKRPQYPQASAKQRDWLERKSIAVRHLGHDPERLYSENLAERLAQDFARLAPVYALLIHAHEIHDYESAARRNA